MDKEILQAFIDGKIFLRIGDYRKVILKELMLKNITWIDGRIIKSTDVEYMGDDNKYLAMDKKGLYVTELKR